MRVPVAAVVASRGYEVTVACPYCGREHTHTVLSLGHLERHAPGCGLTRSIAQRTAGYTFTTPKKENHR